MPRSPAPGRATRVHRASSRPARTVRPGPRHHAPRGRGAAARRWGVGGGLRPPAAAGVVPPVAVPSLAAVTTASPVETTTPSPSASPSPTPSLDLAWTQVPLDEQVAAPRLARRSLRAGRREIRRGPDLHRWPGLAGTAAWRRCPGLRRPAQGSFASWQDSAVGWWNPQEGPDMAATLPARPRSPLGTSCTIVRPTAAPTSTTPFKGRIESIGIGPKGIVAQVHSDLDWDAWVTKKLGLRTNNDWTCRVKRCHLPEWRPPDQAEQPPGPEGRVGGRGLRAGRLPGPGLRLVQPRWRALDRDGAERPRPTRSDQRCRPADLGSVVGVSDGFIATGAYPDGTCADPNGSCRGCGTPRTA